MKLKNLFWFATGASISYHLVKNRKEIKTEVTESSQLVKGIQDNLAKIQRNSILSKTKRPIFKNW
ncbi:MAG: hypothetical protein ACLRZG_00955 [Streptococcus sp.]